MKKSQLFCFVVGFRAERIYGRHTLFCFKVEVLRSEASPACDVSQAVLRTAPLGF